MEPNLEATQPTGPLEGPSKFQGWWTAHGPIITATTVAVAPLLVLAGAVTLLVMLVDDKRLLLDYLRTLVWPAVVIAVLWWLREPLRSKLADLLKVSVAGASAEFYREQQVNEELTEGIQEPVQVLDGGELIARMPREPKETQPERAPSAATAVEPTVRIERKSGADSAIGVESGQPAEVQEQRRATVDDERARRAAIEKIIRDSAGWGWDMARLGQFKSKPVPVIEWGDDGQPRIVRGEGQRARPKARTIAVPPDSRYDPYERARRLEREVKTLSEEVNRPLLAMENNLASLAITGDPRAGKRRTLAQLKEQLALLDPNSPWAQ